ncbi:MAG: hypothetical protein GQE15_32610 [Archangiaceae bacterium]|nr:hypothetical protein [Archangiaceae bacterium]
MRSLPFAVLVVAAQALADLPPPELVLPSGSADYKRTIRLVQDAKRKKRTTAQLAKDVAALKLKPHALGCEYYFLTPPPPPPGITFEPKLMPSDWVGTFGEVAMVHLGGWGLERDEYDALHKAAHGKLPGFPNCGQAPMKK